MMRRLHQAELESSPVVAVRAHSTSGERARAARVVASLHRYLEDELGLSPEQRVELELAIEQALVLSLRVAP